MNIREFDDAAAYLSERIRNKLLNIASDIKQNTYEIRLRTDKPIVLSGSYGTVFVAENNNTVHLCTQELLCAEKSDISDTVARICEYSVYAHQEDIANGFITFGNGHRAGFCGTAVVNEGRMTAFRKIESVNIRISRNILISLRRLCPTLYSDGFNGILVCGPPCSGKTTLLRNIARECSSSFSFGYMKTVIVDERFEIGNDSGINCDVIKGIGKLEGIIHATRVMSPELVVTDEVCTKAEADEILSSCRTGVRFALSAHAGDVRDLFLRQTTSGLLYSGFFDYVFFLNKENFNVNVHKTEDLINEYSCRNNDNI